jgi:hypothetical protein
LKRPFNAGKAVVAQRSLWVKPTSDASCCGSARVSLSPIE